MQIFGPWPDYLLADGAVANPIDALRRAHQRSAQSLRLHFLSHTQTSPTRYRKTFGTGR